MIDWPSELRGHQRPVVSLWAAGMSSMAVKSLLLDEDELRRIASQVKGECDSVAITSVFSPVDASHEQRAAAIMREALGDDFPISISSEIGSVSLLEREKCHHPECCACQRCETTSESFIAALAGEGITDAEVYLCQNDGTPHERRIRHALPDSHHCVRSHKLHSRRIVFDGLERRRGRRRGWYHHRPGVLTHGFPRESMLAVEIGGVRTNFRMPDIISIGLGGGSIVRQHEDGTVTVGPDSVGYRVTKEALCFGGRTLTATDIVVAAGAAEGVGDPALVADWIRSS